MKTCIRYLLALAAFPIATHTYSQTQLQLPLKEAIELAQKNSLDYRIATNLARSSYWNFQAYRSGFLTKLSLNGTLPDYYRTINAITLPTGQNAFISQDVANSGLNLNLSQNIGLTGGNISVGSSVRRIDNYGNFNQTAYTSVPFTFSYFQDNLFYNNFKWKKKIEPLRLQEAQRGYLESLENISYNTIGKYFELLLAEVQLNLDRQNLKNIDTLVKITQARFEIGTGQLNDVLQSKMSLLNAKKAVSNSTLAMETAQQNLIRFLSLDKRVRIEPIVPSTVTLRNFVLGMIYREFYYLLLYSSINSFISVFILLISSDSIFTGLFISSLAISKAFSRSPIFLYNKASRYRG
jgi:outer membrane protein